MRPVTFDRELLRTLPGEQAQVDWAYFGRITVGRAERALMGFVMVLSYSRALWPRFYPDARMSSFLAGHESCFEALGGVARVVLYDNLKSAVLERHHDAIRFNPTLNVFAQHYRFEPRPVSPARGNERDGRSARFATFELLDELRDILWAAHDPRLGQSVLLAEAARSRGIRHHPRLVQVVKWERTGSPKCFA